MPIQARTAGRFGPIEPSLVPTADATYPPPTIHRLISRIGRLRVVGELGRGGMGVVYRVEDPDLRRERAVKIMHTHLAADPVAKERFLREAQAITTVEHPNVVPVYEVGEANGLPYLVMPLFQGRTLADWLKGCGPRPPVRWLRVAAAVADGLAAVHAAGLVHRDVKPSNFWLEAGDKPGAYRSVRLLDFGLAKPAGGSSDLSRTGEVLGTLGYMAPEQVNGDPVDHRADLFSLGCAIYELATGTRAFAGTTAFDTARLTVTEHPPSPATVNPMVSSGLSAFVMSLLAKDPEDRPATAREVRDTLRDIDVALRGRTDSALSGSSPAIRAMRRHTPRTWSGWEWVVLAISAFGLGAAGALWTVWRFL